MTADQQARVWTRAECIARAATILAAARKASGR
jgi:hypothetical protein